MSVLGAFKAALPPASRLSSTGYYNFDCPLCGDRRGRGGFSETPTGGWRYKCFNAGCEAADRAIGWEPGGGLGGRPRKLFRALGGDPKALPISDLMKAADTFRRDGSSRRDGGDEAVYSFPEVELPPGCVPLLSAADGELSDEQAIGLASVVEFLESRGGEIAEAHQFMWSPMEPSSLVVPYLHHGRVVGWTSRSVGVVRRNKYKTKCSPDYVFRQDRLERSSDVVAVVVEGELDAVAVDGVALRSSSPTKKQELLLNLCGQDVVVLPDMERSGAALVAAAERNNWFVSVPRWDRGVKDACTACARYGMLYTVESVVKGATRNYAAAKIAINVR